MSEAGTGARLPSQARIVVVGAGAIGCSTAMHLAEMGERDVLVLEKSGVTHGSTWHAAGLVGQYRSRSDLTQLMQSSVRVFEALAAEVPIDWRPVGSLRLASSPARWQEYRRAEPIARAHGQRSGNPCPAARSKDPRRRYRNRVRAPGAPGRGRAHRPGAHCLRAGRAGTWGVGATDRAHAGDRSAGGGLAASVCGDVGTFRPASRASWPQRSRSEFYLKPEVGRFAIGGWEPDTIPAFSGDMPFGFGCELFTDEMERLQPILEAAMRRVPLIGEMGLQRVVNGPIPFTPDGEPILGPSPDLDNVWLGIGFSSGVAASGGAGQALAHWIVEGAPEFALPSLAPSRFGNAAIPLDVLNARAIMAYSRYYALAQSMPG